MFPDARRPRVLWQSTAPRTLEAKELALVLEGVELLAVSSEIGLVAVALADESPAFLRQARTWLEPQDTVRNMPLLP